MSLYTTPSYLPGRPGRTAYAPPTNEKAKQQHGGFMKKALIGTAVTAAILGGGGAVLNKTHPELVKKGLGLLREHAPEGLKNIAQSAQQKVGSLMEHGLPAFKKAWDANATAPNIFSRLTQTIQTVLANPQKQSGLWSRLWSSVKRSEARFL